MDFQFPFVCNRKLEFHKNSKTNMPTKSSQELRSGCRLVALSLGTRPDTLVRLVGRRYFIVEYQSLFVVDAIVALDGLLKDCYGIWPLEYDS